MQPNPKGLKTLLKTGINIHHKLSTGITMKAPPQVWDYLWLRVRVCERVSLKQQEAFSSHTHTDRLTDRQWVLVPLTLAVTQVLDLDALLFLAGRLLHLAGVVIGTAVWGAHRVEADVRAVDVANAPAEREIALGAANFPARLFMSCVAMQNKWGLKY